MNTIKKILKEYWPYLIIVLAITLPWFLKSGFLFFTDMAWGPIINIDWSKKAFIFWLIIKSLSLILPLALLQKLFISITLLVVLLGGKKIVDNFIPSENFKEKFLVFAISLFMLFNPFVYDRIMYGQFGIVLSFGLLCLCFGYLLDYLKTNKNKYIFYAAIYLGLAIQFSLHFIFLASVFYLLFLFLVYFKRKEIVIRKFIIYTLLAMLVVAVINFNIIIGLFGEKSQAKSIQNKIQRQDLIAFQTSGRTSIDALKNVVMMSGFWGKDQFRYIDLTTIKGLWGRAFILLLIFIIWGVIKSQKTKDKSLNYLGRGLIIVYLVAVVLAVGIKMPIAKETTEWLFDHFPFYKGMRETQKWVAVIVVVYAVFLSLGVKEFVKSKIVKVNKFVVTLFLAGIIIMQAPLLLFGLWGQVRPVNYPADWYEINDYIVSNDNCQSKTLFLPWHMYMHFSWIGNIITVPALRFFECPVFRGTNMEWAGIYDSSKNENSKSIEEWLLNKGENDLILNSELNIRYIILAKETDWENYLWFDESNNLKLIKETENLRLYENQREEQEN